MTNLFTPAEELLQNDYAGNGRKQLLDELADMEFSTKRAMDAGLSIEDMNSAKKLMAAVDAGKKAVDAVWNKLNR